jgi:hypothetical protein
MQLVLVIVYVVVAWHFLNVCQRKMGIFYFGKASDYFVYKLILAALLGWIIIPIGLIGAIVEGITANSGKK